MGGTVIIRKLAEETCRGGFQDKITAGVFISRFSKLHCNPKLLYFLDNTDVHNLRFTIFTIGKENNKKEKCLLCACGFADCLISMWQMKVQPHVGNLTKCRSSLGLSMMSFYTPQLSVQSHFEWLSHSHKAERKAIYVIRKGK